MNASHDHHYGLRGYVFITLSLAGIFFLLIYLNQALLADNGLLNLAWYAYATLFPAILIGLLGSTAWEYIRQNKAQQPFRPETAQAETRLSQSAPIVSDLGDRLHRRYGLFWWYKVRILLLVGEPEQVEAIAPGLTTQHWLEGHRTLLLWGGSLQTEPDAAQLAALRRLRRFR
ncbi:type VI secretion protein VasK, partial [Photorhabdus sp. S8-52]